MANWRDYNKNSSSSNWRSLAYGKEEANRIVAERDKQHLEAQKAYQERDRMDQEARAREAQKRVSLPTLNANTSNKYNNLDLSQLYNIQKPNKPVENMNYKEFSDYKKDIKKKIGFIDERNTVLTNLDSLKREEATEEEEIAAISNPLLRGIAKVGNKISNTGVGKFLDRASGTAADTATYGTQDYLKDKRDTGSGVANTIADILGMAGGMAVNPSGMASSANKILSPLGNATEKAVSKVALPKVASKIAPSMARGASEFAAQGALMDYGRGEETGDIISNVGKNALSGAAFGVALKSASMALPKIKSSAIKETITRDGVSFTNPNNKLKPLNSMNEVASTIEVPKINSPKTTSINTIGEIKQRKFKTNIETSPNTNPTLKNDLNSIKMNYEVKSNKDTLAIAQDFVNKNYDEALKIVKSPNEKFTAESGAMAQELLRKAQNEGKWTEAIDIIEATAKKATNAGQAIQSLSMWSKMTPEGMLKYANRQLEKASTKTGKKVKLTEDFAKDLTDKMKKINKLPEGNEKVFETAKVLADIDEQLPKTIWRKISTVQAMAQLLNPKTMTRNIVGNTIFGGLENASNVIGTPLDTVISKITGKKTTVLPSIKTQLKAGKEGFLQSVKEQLAGINTGDVNKLDLGAGRTFKKNSALGKLETGLNLSLKSTDEGFKNAAKQESLRQQMKIAGVDKPTDGMLEIANKLAEYRTFQDTNGLSKGFTNLKDGLNSISSFFTGTKEFGLGDLILKYAKTPANILARAIDYSPAGVFNTLKTLPINGREFNQKAFVDSISRVTTGSGLIALGYGLNKLGIITGRSSKDKDVARFEEQIGKRQYSINFNALKRYLASGNEEDARPIEGDRFTTWDWAAPVSIVLGIGANIGQNNGDTTDLLTTIADASAAGINTIFEQPLLSGVKNLTAYGDLLGGITTTVAGIPSSFTPTLGKQISQLGDNTTRSTYDPSLLTKSLNQVKAKTPGVASSLLPQTDTFGQDRKAYDTEGLRRNLDVLINPAFSSEYKPKNDIVMKIYDNTGETVQFPRVAPQSITLGKEKYNLTAEDYREYQQRLGEGTQKILTKYANSSPDDKTASKIQSEITALNKSIRDTIIKRYKK